MLVRSHNSSCRSVNDLIGTQCGRPAPDSCVPCTIDDDVHVSIPPCEAVCLTLVGNADDTTRRSCARVTRLLALLGVALSKVISTRMNDDGSAKDRVLADELNLAVGDGPLCVALTVGLEVA